MKAHGMRKTAMLAAIGAALSMPIAAFADPAAGVWSGDSAAPVPHIPGTFAGSPTNDDPNAGQFTATFDATGFVGVGRASEPGVLEVTPVNNWHSSNPSFASGNSAASESTFAKFKADLRALASRQPNTQTAQR
jgi:hypothetical protein